MKTNVALSILLALLPILCLKLNAQTFEWGKNLTGSQWQEVRSLAIDEDKNVYTGGMFGGTIDFNPGNDIFKLTSAGGFDAFVLKFDAAGNFIWVKNFGGMLEESLESVKVDALHNVFIAGRFSGTSDFDPGPGVYNLTSAGQLDFYVVKLDSSGIFCWAKGFGNIETNWLYSMDIDQNSNVVITGMYTFNGFFDNFSVGAADNPLTENSIFIYKLNASGEMIWQKSVFGNSICSYSLSIDPENNIYITGEFGGTTDFDPGPETYNLLAAGQDAYVLKLNQDGDFVWAKKIGGIYAESGSAINAKQIDCLYFTGIFSEECDFDPGPLIYELTSFGEDDIFVEKLDASGNFIWAKQMGGKYDDVANAIAVDNEQNVYTMGEFYDTVDFDPGPQEKLLIAGYECGVYINSLSANGDYNWAQPLCALRSKKDYTIETDIGAGLLISSVFEHSADFDPGPEVYKLLTYPYTTSIFIVKWSNGVVGLKPEILEDGFHIYPNPTTQLLKVDLEKTYTSVEIVLSNLVGQVVLRKSFFATNHIEIEIQEPAGIYFFEIITDKLESRIVKVVKEK